MGRPKGSRNRRTDANAEAIFDLLSDSPRTGWTKRELVEELGVGDQAFDTAMAYLKDIFQEEKGQPIVYDPRSHRYRFAGSTGEARDYATWILKRLLTHTRRHAHFTKAVEERWPDSRRVKRIARHQEILADDIEDLLEEAMRGDTPAVVN